MLRIRRRRTFIPLAATTTNLGALPLRVGRFNVTFIAPLRGGHRSLKMHLNNV